MASKLRDIARIMGKTEANNPDNNRLLFSGESTIDSAETVRIASDAAMSVYTDIDSLPVSSLSSGQHAYVTGNNRYYISNGSGWYNVATANATPYWDSAPNDAYTIVDSVTPLIITAKARDSDNSDANLLHQSFASDSAAFLVDITRDSSVFTFTPKTADSVGASVTAGDLTDSNTNDFIYTFKFSDGINFVSKAVTINYNFAVFDELDPFGDTSQLAFYKLDGNGNDEMGNYDATGYRAGSSTGFQTSTKKYGTHSLNASATTLDLPDVRTAYPITISAWIRPDDWNDASFQDVMNTTIASNRVSFGLYNWSSGFSNMLPFIAFGGTSHITYTGYSGITFTNLQWYHIIYCASAATTAYCYINGVKNSGSTNHGGTHGGQAGWALGGNFAGAEHVEGYVDHVRVFNKVLSDSEAQSLYDNGG
jgi:hypothetical protein